MHEPGVLISPHCRYPPCFHQKLSCPGLFQASNSSLLYEMVDFRGKVIVVVEELIIIEILRLRHEIQTLVPTHDCPRGEGEH